MLHHWQSSWRWDKAAATGEQIKEKGPRSTPVSFSLLSQSEILNLTLSLFLGGTCKKLLELWHCFVLGCARENPYLPRAIINTLWIGDIQPIRAASGALTSFVGERKKILIIPPSYCWSSQMCLTAQSYQWVPLPRLFKCFSMAFGWLVSMCSSSWCFEASSFVILSLLKEAPQPLCGLACDCCEI